MHSNSTLRAIVPMATALSAQEVLLSQTLQYDVSYLNGGYAYSISGSAMDPISGSTRESRKPDGLQPMAPVTFSG